MNVNKFLHQHVRKIIVGTTLVAFVGPAQQAAAGLVYLNVPTAQLSVLNPVVTERFKFDGGGGVDQMLFKQPDPAGYPSADLIRMNGTNTGSATYTFTVTHTTATDKYAIALTNGAVTGGASFAGAGPNSTLTKTFASNELDYNILHIYVRAGTGPCTAVNPCTASFSGLSFMPGAGLTTVGSLDTTETIINADYDQWLAAPTGTNLELFDWTLTGSVTLAMAGIKPSTERLKFELSGKKGTFINVPEPSSLFLATLGLLLSGFLRGRHRVRWLR